MKYIFSASIMANTFAMTAVMIALSLGGKSEMAASVGIVQGATIAVFHAFSANARNVLLNPTSGISVGSILWLRLALLLPLGGLSFWLSTQLAGVESLLAFGLVVRRSAEWIAEVHLTELELHSRPKPSVRFLALQAILTAALVSWLLADLPFALWVTIVWATSPLWVSCTSLLRGVRIGHMIVASLSRLQPHIGSTAIIGISVYAFRLLILLLVGKSLAGDLYAAFAIGGVLGSVFAQALGPTLALHKSRGSLPRIPVWLNATLGLSILSGTALFVMATGRPDLLIWTGKPELFWIAVGLSLIGGVVMVAAQWVRVCLLQHHTDKDVFGPDVLMNILIVGSIPYLFHLLGKEALASLYLISSTLAFIFYYCAAKSAALWVDRFSSWYEPARDITSVLVLAPIFFLLDGSIFHDPTWFYDTGGLLTRLPIPVSVLACYGGIMFLGEYRRATLTLRVIFTVFALMLVSSIMSSHEQTGQQQAKLILLTQFVLPMFALVLGQLLGAQRDVIAALGRVFLWVLAVLVPVQLVATWVRGQLLLSPHLYLFSVYQYLQYVPLVLVAAYLVSLWSVWGQSRYQKLLLTLGVFMGIYAAASISGMALVLLLGGILCFAVYEKVCGHVRNNVLVLCVLVVLSAFSYFTVIKDNPTFVQKVSRVQTAELESGVPRNIAERMTYWKFYAGEVLDSASSTTWGHARPPDRTQYPSAHNYYLDFAYNFGLIALVPIVGLIVLTLFRVYRNWGTIWASPSLLGLTAVALFLILVDNSFKVGMRQPYPGIFTFFLWGVLLAQLSSRFVHSERANLASPV
jgi:hypothetical protein